MKTKADTTPKTLTIRVIDANGDSNAVACKRFADWLTDAIERDAVAEYEEDGEGVLLVAYR